MLKLSLIWDLSFLMVGTVKMSASWDVMLCILVKIHVFLDEGGSRILWNTSTLLHDCIMSHPKRQQPLCVQLTYVLILHDFKFGYCISHFSSWKMLPKISLCLEVWHAMVEITRNIPKNYVWRLFQKWGTSRCSFQELKTSGITAP